MMARWSRHLPTFIAVMVLAGVVWLVVIVFAFWQASRPAIEYEAISPAGMPLSPVCPGQRYQFEVEARARRGPAVVAVTENWVSESNPRFSILDAAPEWRIIPEPVQGTFVVISQVPEDITPGRYTYLRALGLSNPFILRIELVVRGPEVCG